MEGGYRLLRGKISLLICVLSSSLLLVSCIIIIIIIIMLIIITSLIISMIISIITITINIMTLPVPTCTSHIIDRGPPPRSSITGGGGDWGGMTKGRGDIIRYYNHYDVPSFRMPVLRSLTPTPRVPPPKPIITINTTIGNKWLSLFMWLASSIIRTKLILVLLFIIVITIITTNMNITYHLFHSHYWFEAASAPASGSRAGPRKRFKRIQ